MPFSIEGEAPRTDERTATDLVEISPDYFKVMEIPTLAGRQFSAGDTEQTPPVGIINAAFGRSFFNDRDPVGRTVLLGQPATAIRIVGMVADTRQSSVATAPPPVLYVPFLQRPFWITTFVAQTATPPGAMADAIRHLVARIAPDARVLTSGPMQELVEASYSASDHRTIVLALLSALALVLAAVGVYGMFAYRVAQGTQEIGVRMALGADSRQILRQVLSQAMRLAAAGLCAGLLLSVILTPLARALLFHVSPFDPWTLVTATLLVIVVSAIAAYLPARRAARVDPITALRC